jgi:alkylhydroperoxidase/carboxymuconolactone decarboxylase family protein YurZ
MKSKSFIAISFALGLLASCAHIDPHPMDMSSAIRNARTSADHDALARHYEDTAKRMQAKAQVQKNMLKEYTRHGYYYGRRTEELQEHTKALIRIYEEAAESNRNMAKFHHRLAEDASQ